MEKSYTTYEIAQFCEVTMRAVTQWIDQGKLPAYRTPGGHRRIRPADFLAFLKRYQMPVPMALRSFGRPRVLIVDDEKVTVALLKRVLAKLGHELEIEVAFDGFEAGQKIMTFLPDLVLLDLRLPGIDGFQVCKRIKNQNYKAIKVLAMTGYHSSEVKKQFLSCGADGYITKPFTLEKITEKVEQLLRLGPSALDQRPTLAMSEAGGVK